MRKHVVSDKDLRKTPPGGWLDLDALAEVEVSSEAERHPIEGALLPTGTATWKASVPGKATITLRFDTPQSITRVLLHFTEAKHERSQEWALFASFVDHTERELLRQGWNFSPGGSQEQHEEYQFALDQVAALTLTIDPDLGKDRYPATLTAWKVAARA